MNTIVSKRYLFIFILMTFLSVPFMGRGLYESSEGRYARVAQTMLTEHDFWMPKLNGHPHLTKPPLTYWVIATGIDIAGENTFGARLFHTIAWILTSLIIVRIGSELESPMVGLFSGLVFATSLLPSIGSWSLTTDPLLVFFQAFTLLALIRFEKESNFQSAFVFWCMTGLAFLTKGPVALLPLLFLGIRWKRTFLKLVKTNLWIMFFIIGMSWYLVLEFNHPGILSGLIKDELILRSTTSFSGRNAFWWAPAAVYGLPFVIGWGAWPFLVSKKKMLKIFEASSSSWQKVMFIWTCGCLIFFSFIQSRLTLYILPLVIPVSLLLGHLIQDTKVPLRICIINISLILVLKSYGTFFHHSPDDSLQLTTFTRSLIGGKPVHLLWEKSLFGVEYYLPTQYKKVINPFQNFALKNDSAWVLYQEKRKNVFNRLVRHQKLEVKQSHAFYNWKLAELIKANKPVIGGNLHSTPAKYR